MRPKAESMRVLESPVLEAINRKLPGTHWKQALRDCAAPDLSAGFENRRIGYHNGA